MTIPERNVEEEHTAIHMACLAKSKNAKDCGDLTVMPMGYAVQMIEEAIQTERQKRDEVVEAERERMKHALLLAYDLQLLEGSSDSVADHNSAVSTLQALTQPNNQK